MKFFPLVIIFISLSSVNMLYAQQDAKSLEAERQMNLGIVLMKQGMYDSANVYFKKVLQGVKKLPADMAYFFGRNSYHLKKRKQSINWLNKYIQLTGTKGRYYDQASQYLRYAEDEYIEIRREQIANSSSKIDFIENNKFNCDGLTKMLCPVCHGDGVVIHEGLFEEIYKTCPYSLGEGYLTCEEYNLFMMGLLSPKL